MAKRIRVSSDNVTYYTLPGSSGDKNSEGATVDDTVFGQSYQSQDVSILQHGISANAYWKGIAGYVALLKRGGTPTAMTTEAMGLVSGKTYKVTAATKRVISYAHAATVFDNGVDHTADVLSIDYLAGTVTFEAAYTVTGPVTITGYYIPMSEVLKGRSFTLTQGAAEIDTTDYATARANGGNRTFNAEGLRNVSFELGGLYDATNNWAAQLSSRGIFYLEVAPANDAETVFRGFFKTGSQNQSGDVGALEEETVQLNLWVPDGDLVEAPFRWYFGSGSTLNTAVRKCIEAWQNQTTIHVQYLPDGINGQKAECIVTEMSLANELEGLNEFTAAFRATGALVAVP